MMDAIEWNDEYEQLIDEKGSVTVTHSDTDAVYVETESFSGEHRVWYSKSWGPRLKTHGLYDCPSGNQLECEPPWIDAVKAHFKREFGGSDFEGER